MSSERDESESVEDLTAKLISVTDAAQLSGFTTSHIRYLLRNGDIDGEKVGRNWLTTEQAIRDYLKKDRRPGPKKG